MVEYVFRGVQQTPLGEIIILKDLNEVLKEPYWRVKIENRFFD